MIDTPLEKNKIANEKCHISVKNVTLSYDLYFDRATTLKETVINAIHKRKGISEDTGKIKALNGVNLEINHGERVGIIGLNGSGKSTLLKVISGILKPTEGSIHVTGQVQPLIEIGAGFNPEFSGRENIYLNGYMLGFRKNQIREREQDIIDFSELGTFIDVPIKYYSSGMAVRLAFTIATMIRPEILVFDEMLSAGDAEFMIKARRRMDDLLTSAKMLVLVSHDLGLIRSLTERTLLMKQGQVIFDGPSEEAIEYYTELIANNLNEKAAREQLAKKKRAAEEAAKTPVLAEQVVEPPPPDPIEFFEKDTEHLLLNPRQINSGEGSNFETSFELKEPFNELYINFKIFDKLGLQVCHLRNDFSGIRYHNIKAGKYKISIPIAELPFRPAQYQFLFQIVGRRSEKDQFIKDSSKEDLTILGDAKSYHLVKHSWNLSHLDKVFS